MVVTVNTSANPAVGQQDADNKWLEIFGTGQEVIDELAQRHVSTESVVAIIKSSTDVVFAYVKIQ